MKLSRIIMILLALVFVASCVTNQSSSDKMRDLQETQIQELVAQVGLPAIKNFRMYKMLKHIFEMCDKEISTYTYMSSEVTGKLTFVCHSIGYGIPYASQLTAPVSVQRWLLKETADRVKDYGKEVLPQADPDGIFKPASADGTWVVCLDPNTGAKVDPVFFEPRMVVSPFKMPCSIVINCEDQNTKPATETPPKS